MKYTFDSLTLLLTYDCNAACDHCYYHSKPGKTGHLSPEQAESYFDAIVKTYGRLSGVKILGGEPFLYYKPLLEIIRMANRRRAQVVLLTNGVWGGSEALAARVAMDFKEAGLTAIVLGASGFHRPYVAPEVAMRAARAARKAGIQVVVANYVLNGLNETNAYDLESRRVEDLSRELDLPVFAGELDWQGRASSKLVQLSSIKPSLPTGTCPNQLIGKVKDPVNYAHGVAVDAGGWVTVCHGIAIGNTNETPLEEILKGYDPEANPIIHAIREKGPLGLLDLPEAVNLKLEPDYKSLCHMCFDIRNRLRPSFPNELGPANCYQEM